MNNLGKPDILFPPPDHGDPESGLLFVGGRLTVANLHSAYSKGIFPWPHEGYPMLWFSPPERGVIDFEELHIPKKIAKLQRNNSFTFTTNQAFTEVMKSCAHIPRKGQQGTWINQEMLIAYGRFHAAGYAHSFECWQEDKLIGGLYGVYVGGVFSGESMFGLKDNVSKLCLLECITKLTEMGKSWLDIQMVTSVTEQFGGKYIDRDDFLQRLVYEKTSQSPFC
jgi:leucyl/phenylalanyl-tRNA--protein transferase